MGDRNEEGRWRVEVELLNSWQHLCFSYYHTTFTNYSQNIEQFSDLQ